MFANKFLKTLSLTIFHISTLNGMQPKTICHEQALEIWSQFQAKNLQNNLSLIKDTCTSPKEDPTLSPLIQATKNHDAETIHSLLSQKADFNATDNNGRTALEIACRGNVNSAVAQLLINNTSDRQKLERLRAQGCPGNFYRSQKEYAQMIKNWNTAQKMILIRIKEISKSVRYIHNRGMKFHLLTSNRNPKYGEEFLESRILENTQKACLITYTLMNNLSRKPVEHILSYAIDPAVDYLGSEILNLLFPPKKASKDKKRKIHSTNIENLKPKQRKKYILYT